jgi:hypothetical protein
MKERFGSKDALMQDTTPKAARRNWGNRLTDRRNRGLSPVVAIKKIIVFSGVLVGLLIAMVAIVILLFLHEERQRKELLVSYEMPNAFLEKMLSIENGSVSALMDGQETMMCAIGGYGDVENISSLSEEQKSSLPKSKLPSEGLTWYLLFFNNNSISRIYLVDSTKLEITRDSETACVNRGAHFVIQKRQLPNGENDFVVHITSERKNK